MTGALNRKASDSLFSWIFVTPTFLLYTLFIIVPIGFAVYYGMHLWDGAGPMRFVGFYNFRKLALLGDYWIVVKNTGVLTALSLVIQIPLALVLAFLVNNLAKGYKAFRFIYFVPVVITPSAIGLAFTLFLNGEVGPLNQFLDLVGLPALRRAWLSDGAVVSYSVAFPIIWQYIGFHFVIILAAMQKIPDELFECARLDGASAVKLFFRMVLPLLVDSIRVCSILCMTGALKAFEHSYIMTWGGPGVKSSWLALYMFRTAITESEIGGGSAIAVTILVYAFVLTYLFNLIFKNEAIEY